MLGLSNNRPAVRLEVLRLIDQHDGDVVFDGVDQAAGVTHQRFGGRRAVLEWTFALGADENLEQVGRERSEEHTSELQSPCNLVCRLLLEKKKKLKEQKVRVGVTQ